MFGDILAYPFAPAPFFREFKERLMTEYRCVFKNKGIIKNGEPYTIQYIERTNNNITLQCSIEHYEDDDMVILADVRSICRRLNIDPKEFGMSLG